MAFSDESERLLDTGGALVKAAPLLREGGEGPILVHNVDIVTDLDLRDLVASHTGSGAEATLLVDPDRKSSRMLLTDPLTGRLCGWTDLRNGAVRPEGLVVDGRYKLVAFGGIHVIEQSLLDRLSDYARRHGSDCFSITPFYVDYATSEAGRIATYTPSAPYRWFDIGTPEKLARASAAFRQ